MSVHALLTEYLDIFLLEPGEVGCTGLLKHEIRVGDDETFKERFQRIPPSMVEKLRAYMKEMLEMGIIHPSQSPWCNTYLKKVLARKNKWVTLTSNAQAVIDMLKKACIDAPVLAFADFNKPFLLETDMNKLGLGAE